MGRTGRGGQANRLTGGRTGLKGEKANGRTGGRTGLKGEKADRLDAPLQASRPLKTLRLLTLGGKPF